MASKSDSRKIAVHMVGAGGSGVSGLALLLSQMGFQVSGSDAKDGDVLDKLRAAGVRITIGHSAKNVPKETALLAYSSAVKPDNPEILEAKRRGIAILTRGQLLAEVSRMKRTVTVAGSHGKTTTSSMIGWVFSRAGINPTVIVGGIIRNTGTSAFLGKGDTFVMETDESDGSFLHTQPLVAVVTNIDNDHLDYWKTFPKLVAGFRSHLERVPFYGRVILCQDDPVIAKEILPAIKKKKPVWTYGFTAASDFRAGDIKHSSKGFQFDVYFQGKKLGNLTLRIPGRHNVLNALAAVAAAQAVGIKFLAVKASLAQFKGIRRRLEWLGRESGVTVLDDYGHHPTEIRATLEAVREFFKPRHLFAVFQPHRYSRTKMLANDFAAAFQNCDQVWVCPIYAASEKPIKGVSEDLVIKALEKRGIAGARFPGRVRDLMALIKPGDAFITIGAGDVWKLGEELVRRLA